MPYQRGSQECVQNFFAFHWCHLKVIDCNIDLNITIKSNDNKKTNWKLIISFLDFCFISGGFCDYLFQDECTVWIVNISVSRMNSLDPSFFFFFCINNPKLQLIASSEWILFQSLLSSLVLSILGALKSDLVCFLFPTELDPEPGMWLLWLQW